MRVQASMPRWWPSQTGARQSEPTLAEKYETPAQRLTREYEQVITLVKEQAAKVAQELAEALPRYLKEKPPAAYHTHLLLAILQTLMGNHDRATEYAHQAYNLAKGNDASEGALHLRRFVTNPAARLAVPIARETLPRLTPVLWPTLDQVRERALNTMQEHVVPVLQPLTMALAKFKPDSQQERRQAYQAHVLLALLYTLIGNHNKAEEYAHQAYPHAQGIEGQEAAISLAKYIQNLETALIPGRR